MKMMLVFILGLAMLSGTTYSSETEGQQGKGMPGRPDRLTRMQKNLGLSDEQVEQIREIRKNGGQRKEVLAVLTEEQRALMKENRGKQRRQGRKGGGRGQGKVPGKKQQGN